MKQVPTILSYKMLLTYVLHCGHLTESTVSCFTLYNIRDIGTAVKLHVINEVNKKQNTHAAEKVLWSCATD